MELHREALIALRSALKRRSFAALVILCMALGIGVNSAIFSVVDTALLRPLPYRDPEQLAFLLDVHKGPSGEPAEAFVSPPNFVAWREQNQVFSQLEAIAPQDFNLSVNGEPQRVKGSVVTHGLFPMLGIRTALGRTFLPEEDRPGGARSVVIGHGFWQQHLGASPEALGHTLTLDGESYKIVGVMEPGFHFLQDADLWVPLAMDPVNPANAASHYLLVSGRLKPGLSFEQAESEMATIAARLAQQRPDSNTGWTVKVQDLRNRFVKDLRPALLVLLAAVGFILLISCANVSNLLLTRAIEQEGEFAIRTALGARRSSLVNHMLVESVLLSLLGGLLGLVLAGATLKALPLIAPQDIALLRDLRLDGRVLGFSFVLSLLAGIFPVVFPALKASSPELQSTLKNGSKKMSGGTQSRRLLDSLVVVEVALSIILLIGAGLMLKSFSQLHATDPGFNPKNVVKMEMTLPDGQYSEPSRRIAFWRGVLEKISSLPGVVAAGATSGLPVHELSPSTIFIVENRVEATPGEMHVAFFRRVTPGFFRAMGIPLEEGRLFQDSDTATSLPVAIISREMANRYWPNQSPLGRRIQRVRKAADNPWFTVVGVVGDVKDASLGALPGAAFYIPYEQNPTTAMHLVVRTSTPPLGVVGSIRRAVQEVDPNQPVAEVATMEDWILESLARRRFSTLMLSLFAGLGLVLAVVGIYGVLSYSVSQRRHEMGIRLALGADSRNLVLLVLRRGLLLTGIGLTVGVALALILTRLLTRLLYGVEATDPPIFASLTAMLLFVGLVASYLPARRASRVDPIVSLESE